MDGVRAEHQRRLRARRDELYGASSSPLDFFALFFAAFFFAPAFPRERGGPGSAITSRIASPNASTIRGRISGSP